MTQRRSSRAPAAVVLLVAVMVMLLAGGCRTGASSESPREPAATTADLVPQDSVPDQLQGTWLVELTRTDIRQDLAEAGFGKYADKFIKVERLGPRVRMAVTYADDSFDIAWLYPDGWYVGWYGTAHERDGVLTVTDAESLTSDAYRWHIAGTALTLRFHSTTTPDQHGIPFEAYSWAYFSRPLQHADCTPEDLDACWQG